MRDEDKPFVCYRRGRWQMQIKPRNGEGWRLFGMWMAGLAVLTCGHLALVGKFEDDGALVGWLTLGFVLLTCVWAFAMIRWMLPRSVVVRLD